MKKAIVLIGMSLAVVGGSGCGLFRWSGYYTHDDTFPQLHYDWAHDPYFPSTSNGEKPPKLKFPKTAEEHRKAADRFYAKARSYRWEAAMHRDMKASYEGQDPSVAADCDGAIRRLEALAQDMEHFAKWHLKRAEKGKE